MCWLHVLLTFIAKRWLKIKGYLEPWRWKEDWIFFPSKLALTEFLHTCITSLWYDYFSQGEVQEAIEYLKQYVEVAERSGQETAYSQACHNLGSMFNSLVRLRSCHNNHMTLFWNLTINLFYEYFNLSKKMHAYKKCKCCVLMHNGSGDSND